MTDITVRYLDFDFEEDKPLDAEIIPGHPEMSYFMVGLSMLMPYVEPYVVKHSIEGQKLVKDEELRHDMEQYSHQEAAHYKQHKRFNERARAAYPGLEVLEKKAAADYERFSRKGLKFNLAYAEGFESMTHPWVMYMWQSGMIKQMKGPMADIYAWHFLEEMEHRTVAFDAYYYFYNDYFFRLRVSLIAQFQLVNFMFQCARVMLKQERDQFKQRGGWVGRTKRIWLWVRLALKYFIPPLMKSYLRGYNPRNLKVPAAVTELAEVYTQRAYAIRT